MARNDRPLSTRFSPALLQRVEQAARDDERTLSQQVRRYVRDGLARDGYLPTDSADATTKHRP